MSIPAILEALDSINWCDECNAYECDVCWQVTAPKEAELVGHVMRCLHPEEPEQAT